MQVSARIYVVRFLFESCIELGLVSLIAIVMTNEDRFSYFQDGITVILAFITLFCLGFTPFYLLYVGKRLIDKPLILSDREKRSYEALFAAYKPNDRIGIKFSAMFFFRRFLMLNVIVLLPEQRNI